MNNQNKTFRVYLRTFLLILRPYAFFLLLTGCQAIGVFSHASGEKHPAAYVGLAGQSVGVMVWADRAILNDWPTVQLDLASRIQDDLHKSTAEELKGTTWPV